MKKNVVRRIIYFSFVLVFIACSEPTQISIIPKPNSIKTQNEEFQITAKTLIKFDASNDKIKNIVEQFTNRIKNSSGLNLKLRKDYDNTIQFELDEGLELGNEGYELLVKENEINIKGKTEAGLFYGMQTLLQLIDPAIFAEKKLNAPITIPSVKISDQPSFVYRGAMLDVSRHFFPKEFVKKYIDILAFHKLNRFHWHLTDDQGWRIEIKKYPKLTEIGAWRSETMGDGKPYGGFYTQEDIKEIVQYAKERFITIIPEIEMPGHSMAALAAYPELSCTGKHQEVSTTWGVHKDIYCAGNDKTSEFLQNVLDEVIELFPSKYIHIGGDEAPKARWEKCKKCQARIMREGLHDEFELQSYFIKRIEKYLLSRNRYLIGWDEILEGGLAPNATVMSWRGIEGGIKAAQENHDVIMSPNSHCYFDHYQALQNEPYAIGGFTPLEKVYSYNLIPNELNKQEAKHILGAQANMWTEYISTTDYAEYMLLPRLAALSEVVWTNHEQKNYNDFSERMLEQYRRYGYLNWNYRVPTPTGLKAQQTIFKPEVVELSLPIENAVIKYTTNGEEPDLDSETYTVPINITKSTLIKARTVMPDKKLSRVVLFMVNLIDSTKNGISYYYYEGNWEKLPNFSQEKITKSGKAFRFGLDEIKTRDDHYAIVFKSNILIEEDSEYIFYLSSDDGSKLFIDDKLVIDNDGSHSKREVHNSIKLTKGFHSIELQYFEDYEGEALALMIEGKNLSKQEIPTSQLFLNENIEDL